MIKTIYITRSSGGSITSRGLAQVFVWDHEPCLKIEIYNDNPYSFDNDLQDNLREQLKGVLFGNNCWHNFIYKNGELVRNPDLIPFPKELEDLYKHRKLKFTHEVFGDGYKTNYRRNSVRSVFGLDNPISDKIWKMVVDEFQDGKELTDNDFRNWSVIEEIKPWWRFCKKLEIEVNLSNG